VLEETAGYGTPIDVYHCDTRGTPDSRQRRVLGYGRPVWDGGEGSTPTQVERIAFDMAPFEHLQNAVNEIP
jgi:hypothetical protein